MSRTITVGANPVARSRRAAYSCETKSSRQRSADEATFWRKERKLDFLEILDDSLGIWRRNERSRRVALATNRTALSPLIPEVSDDAFVTG